MESSLTSSGPTMSDAEMCWIRQRQLDISAKYNEGPWSDMDYTVWRASYNLGDISDWPLDAVVVRSAKPGESCLLGSVRSAADIFHVEVSTNTSVTVVVSVCRPAELRVRGAPQDWREHFSRSGVRHVQVELDDPRIKCNRDASWFFESAERCAQAWTDMAQTLRTLREQCQQASEGFNVLFHCFGGINRSPAALCAWLVLDGQCSADEAVDCILSARPALQPWKCRDYALLALHRLQNSR